MDKKGNKDKRLNIRISEELQERMKKRAEEENRTLSNYILNLVLVDLESKKKDSK